MSVSSAERLLARAATESDRLRRHLLVAAALRAALEHAPIVVGGTAEEYHAAADYHETDLDLCGPLTTTDRASMRTLGFRLRGRHWYHDASRVAVEFPDTGIDGDEGRVERVRVGEGTALVIGVDDLYLDRLMQATAPLQPEGSIEFASALALAAGTADRIDRRYVLARIRDIRRTNPGLARVMRQLDSKIRRRIRSALG